MAYATLVHTGTKEQHLIGLRLSNLITRLSVTSSSFPSYCTTVAMVTEGHFQSSPMEELGGRQGFIII